jgi:hypothetical protein
MGGVFCRRRLGVAKMILEKEKAVLEETQQNKGKNIILFKL